MPEPHPHSLQGLLRGYKLLELTRFAERIGLKIHGDDDAVHLRAAIHSHLSNATVVQQRFAELTEPQQLVLCAIAAAADGRTGTFPHQGSSGKGDWGSLRRICAELQRMGWLFPDPAYGYGGERGHIVPADLVPLVAAVGAHRLVIGGRPYFVTRQEEGTSAGPEILSALLRLVGALAREPARLTQQGGVYKRDVERLRKVRGAVQLRTASPAWGRIEKALGGLAEHWIGAPWQEEGRDVGMLLWLGIALGLIVDGGGSLQADLRSLKSLQHEGRDGLWRSAILALATFLINVNAAAYTAFELLDGAYWVAPLRWIEDVFGVPLPSSTRDAKCAAAACLLGLGELGLVEATMVEGEPLLRLSAVGVAIRAQQALPDMALEERFRVLPSGDVLVTPYIAPHVQLELECYARPVIVDVVSTYRIEQGLVAQQASEGIPPQKVLDFFTDHAADAMPQPVRFRLEEWLQDIGRIEFMEVALLACDTPEMAERVLAVPSVRKDALEVLGDRWIVIPASAHARLRAALQQAGIVPLREVHRPSGPLSRQAGTGQRQSLSAHLGRLSLGTRTYARTIRGRSDG